MDKDVVRLLDRPPVPEDALPKRYKVRKAGVHFVYFRPCALLTQSKISKLLPGFLRRQTMRVR